MMLLTSLSRIHEYITHRSTRIFLSRSVILRIADIEPYAGTMCTPQMDSLDRAIIRELEEDGRRPMREIARNLDTPEATIRTRMKRLTESGTLRIVAFVDPRELGGAQLSLVQLGVEPSLHNDIVEALVAMPETTYVSTVLGEYDVVVELMCADNQALWDILKEKVARIPGVKTVKTQPILQVHKLVYGTEL